MNLTRSPLVSSLFLGALALASGCSATQAESAPAIVFPTRAEVAKLPSKPPLLGAFGTADVAVGEWTIDSAPLPSAGPYEDASVWGAFARELVQTHAPSALLSPAMKCAAKEVARFHLQHHAIPAESLRRFMVARCGGETPAFAPVVWSSEATRSVSDEEIVGSAREAIKGATLAALAHGHHVVGVAALRDGKQVSVVVAVGADEARIDPGPRTADSTHHVTLRGTARGEYSQIAAFANRGEFGVSRCDSDPRVAAPQFAITCELSPEDPLAWVEVVGQKPGRIVLSALSEVLVYQRDPKTIAYKAGRHGVAIPVSTAAAFTSALVEGVNGVRATAKMKGLSLAEKQSKENERLAGTILDAALTRDDESAEKAMIGLLAGWDVEGGTIRNGEFFLAALAPTNDASAWLDFALERPLGRLTLLDPDARLMAVGPAIPEGGRGLAATVTTYSLFESDDHTADEALLFRRIQTARAARGLSAPARLTVPNEVRQLATLVQRGAMGPSGALNEMLASAASESGASSYGYVLETNDIATMAVPDVFLKPGPLGIAVTITHHRAPGAAWGQYVIFVLLPPGASEPNVQSASDDVGRPGGAPRSL